MTFSAQETLFLVRDGRLLAALQNNQPSAMHSHFLLAYPIADAASASCLFEAQRLAAARGIGIGVMVDSTWHVDLLSAVGAAFAMTWRQQTDDFNGLAYSISSMDSPQRTISAHQLAAWVDLDMSYRPVPAVHLGVRRSPLRSAADVLAVSEHIAAKNAADGVIFLGGLMGYEAQIAGLTDFEPATGFVGRALGAVSSVAIGILKRRSVADGHRRRRESFESMCTFAARTPWSPAQPSGRSVDLNSSTVSRAFTSTSDYLIDPPKALRSTDGGPPESPESPPAPAARSLYCNGGGSGSLRSTVRDATVTEVTIGSGALCGHLFDAYLEAEAPSFLPALFLALSVTRQPDAGIFTCTGGGWIASGEPGVRKLPRIVYPVGAHLIPREAAGEVQTPFKVRNVEAGYGIGSAVVFRPCKSGELGDVLQQYVLLAPRDQTAGESVENTVMTYRGDCVPAWANVGPTQADLGTVQFVALIPDG
jgi:hypothetical protein